MTIYFFSDPHYGHRNYTYGISQWPNKDNCRKFDTLDEMNSAVVRQINSKIGPNDEAYCLGDWSFSSLTNALEFRDRLNCKKIHLILGNHDNSHGKKINPIIPNSQNDLGIHTFFYDLFESVSHYKEFYYQHTLFCLFHFPIASWHKMQDGAIHCFGHCHSSPDNRFFNGGRSMDVGIDGGGPYSIDEIMFLLKDAPIKKEGHHQ